MQARVSGWVASVVVLLLGGCATSISVPQQKIQQQIDARLPVGTPASSPVALSLQSLQCDLLSAGEVNGDQNVALTAQFRASLLQLFQLNSQASLRGRLVYDAGVGAFFIAQPELVELQLDQIPMAVEQKRQLMVNLQQIVATILATTPVYTLEDAAMKNHIDGIEIKDDVMLVHVKP